MEVEGRTDNTTVVAGDNLCPSKTPRGPGDEETRSRWWHHTATDIDSPSPGLLHTLIQLLLNTRIHKWFCLCLGTRLMETQSALIGRTHAAGQMFIEFSMTSEFKKTKKQPNLYLTSKSPSSVTHSMTQQLSLAQNECGGKSTIQLGKQSFTAWEWIYWTRSGAVVNFSTCAFCPETKRTNGKQDKKWEWVTMSKCTASILLLT